MVCELVLNLDKEKREFQALCHEHGCKCTVQRYAVYTFMRGNRSHPDVNAIWEGVRRDLPYITRESVFRILNEFAEFGIIGRLDKIEDARFDGRGSDHGHLICEKCGSIIDFELPKALQNFGTPGDFHTKHIELRIIGLCAKCAEKV